MYSATELRSLNTKPRINDVSLKILSEYYEMFLNPFVYYYHIVSSSEDRIIELRFDFDNFCHLLGIESIVKYNVPFNQLRNYKGQTGWNNVANLIIDIQHLKNINNRRFRNVKAKYVYFYLLPDLVVEPLAVYYNKDNVDANTDIDCEILFYSKVENDNAIIHLGIKMDLAGYYIPKTFFVEKVSKKEDDIYIAHQEEIHVTIEQRATL